MCATTIAAFTLVSCLTACCPTAVPGAVVAAVRSPKEVPRLPGKVEGEGFEMQQNLCDLSCEEF
jgi:hypothetical protein